MHRTSARIENGNHKSNIFTSLITNHFHHRSRIEY